MSNTEVTTLELRADSTQVKAASRDLDKLTDTSKKVERQTEKTEDALDSKNKTLKETSSQSRKATTELERMRTMMDSLRRVAGPLTAALSVAGLVAYTRAALDAADALAKLGRFFGVTIEQLQGWQYAAGQSGVDAATLESSLRRLTAQVGLAAVGTNELSKLAAEMGINITNTQTAFYGIADAIARATTPTERARIAYAAFGEEGTRMALMLANGSAGLLEFQQKALDLGMVLSTDTATKVEQFNDKVDTLQKQMTQAIKIAFLEEFTQGVENLDASLHPGLLESLREFGALVGSILAKLLQAVSLAAKIAGELQEFKTRTSIALFGLSDNATIRQVDMEIQRIEDLIEEREALLAVDESNIRLTERLLKDYELLNDLYERRNQLMASQPKAEPLDVTVDRGTAEAADEAEKLLHAYGDLIAAVEDFRRRIDPQRRKLQQMAQDHEMLAIAVHEGVISIEEYNRLIQESAMLSHKPADALENSFEFAIKRIESAFDDMWQSLLDGSFNFGDALKSLMQNIAADIIRQNITQPLMAFMRGEEGASLQGVGTNLGVMAGGALVGEAMGGGQATQGAMSGAMLGFQMGGPMGAAAGALLGGIFGRRSQRKEQRRQEQMATEQEAQRIQSMRLDLETQIAQINGTYDLTKARERELSQLRDVNRSAAERVHFLQDELERLQEIERIAQEREQLEDRLLQMQGNIVELRKREMESIDASNRPLLQAIYNMEDFAVAAQQMNAALMSAEAEVRQAYQAFVLQADRLERELYALIGGEAELAYQRRLVMEQLDPSLHAMQEQVWMLQDQQQAIQAATEAHDRYMASLDQAEDFLSGIFRSIDDFIFSMMAGETAAGARAVFQRTLAMARAGDQQALSGLVGSAQSFLQSAREEAGSELEFRRQQAAVARSLRGIKQLRPEELIAQQIRAGLLEQADTIKEHMDDLLLLANVTIAEATATIQILQHGNLPQEIAQIADMVLRETVDIAVAIRASEVDLPENYQKLVLGTLGTITATVGYVVDPAKDLSADDRKIILNTVGDLQKTIDYVIRSPLDSGTKQILLTQADTIAKTIQLSLAAKANNDQDAYRILVDGAATVTANLSAITTQNLTAAQRDLLLDANKELNRNIALRAVAASGATGLTAAQVLGLTQTSADLERSLALAVSGGDFNQTEIAALTQSAATLNRSVSTSFTGTLSDWQRALIALAGGDSKVDMSLKGDSSYYAGIEDAVSGGVIGVNANTKTTAERALDQIGELGMLRNEMELNTDGVIQLNSSMSSLTMAIMRLVQLQEKAEQDAAERAAQEKWKRDTEILQKNIQGVYATFATAGLSPRDMSMQTIGGRSTIRIKGSDLAKYGSIEDAFRSIRRNPNLNVSDAAIRSALEYAYAPIQQQFNDYLENLRKQIRELGGTPAFADGGMHTGGMRIVGERGPELEFTGASAIMSYNDLMQSLKSSGDVSAEISNLRSEIRGLRQEARSTAATNADIARKINRIEREGLVVRPDPEEVEDAEVLAI